jgi:methylated-DNA-[protein]-cysteine S-methyltransferase
MEPMARLRRDAPLEKRMIFHTRIETPVGPMTLTKDGDALTGAYLENLVPTQLDGKIDARAFTAERHQLKEYFAGERTRFDLRLAPRGTPFQERVWKALLTVGFGRTASYGEIARAIGRPEASRAVGAANGKNPIAIIIPCHRIIGASGSLVGYAGGLPRKKWLLAHEGHQRRLYTEMIGTPSCVST